MGIDKNKPFPCTSCGQCCRQIGPAIARALNNPHPNQVEILLSRFPYKYDQSGACEKLIDNKCSVYDARPDVCNMEKMHIHYKITREESFQSGAAFCNRIIREAGLDEKFLIPLPVF